MKRVVSIVVVCVLLLHLAGFYIYFVVRLGEIRLEMRHELALLPSNALDLVTIPRSQFQDSWKDKMEMKWKGKMYDIARIESDGETINIFCRHDKDEDDLLSFISAVVNTSQDDQVPHSIIQFLTLEFEVHPASALVKSGFSMIQHNSGYLSKPTSRTTSVLAPPPRT